MRNILSILCTLILPTIVEAASCGLLMTGTASCTNKARTAMTQADPIITPRTKLTRPNNTTSRKIPAPEQYTITQQTTTERPFANKYDHEFREGIYVDITTGEPLFSSTDKFGSGCSQPAFSKSIDRRVITNYTDTLHDMVRMKVRSKTGEVHLGHVFDDGPTATGGKGYCINSASLRFIPLGEMRAESYRVCVKLAKSMKEIYVAGDCFWRTEHYLKQIEGVTTTEVDYANGIIKNPACEEVCTDKMQLVEIVHITYDPKIVSLDLLLGLYFKLVDPTSISKQGNSRGNQRRTGIYHTDPVDLPTTKKVLEEEQKQIHRKIAAEAKPFKSFHTAEEYHQGYLDKHPTGYCHLFAALFEYARKAEMKR